MVLAAYRHDLRAAELCDLQWHQIELAEGRMCIRRVKNGTPSVHPIRADETRALRKLLVSPQFRSVSVTKTLLWHRTLRLW